MKQSRFSKVLSLLLAVLMVLSLTTPATVSASQPEDKGADAVQVQMNVNETKTLKVSGWYRNTAWTSSDPSVVTVDSHGVITAEAEGVATVTAVSTPWFSFAGRTKTTTYIVTVTGSSEAALTVKVNEELALSVNPDGGTVTWSSSDEQIAVVSPEGVVKGVQPGDVTVTAEIVKVKYLFFGWVKREIRSTERFEITVLPAGPETPDIYTVTFESNGGSAVEAQKVEAGRMAVEPAVPTRDNYDFAGWYTDTAFTNRYDFQTPVTADVTLYAKWEAIPEEYSVVFESNGGTVVFTQFVEEGQTVQKPEPPIKSGYAFAGWYADAELTIPYDFDAPVTKNLTLYAKWDGDNKPVFPDNPSQADEYYWNNSKEVLDVIDARTSENVPTENEAKNLFQERGFDPEQVMYAYTLQGEFVDETLAAENSVEKRPSYYLYHLTENGDLWTIYIINGSMFAYPVSMLLDSDLEVEVLFSESDTITSYDEEFSKFYVTIPKETSAVVKVVSQISAEILNTITVEEVTGK